MAAVEAEVSAEILEALASTRRELALLQARLRSLQAELAVEHSAGFVAFLFAIQLGLAGAIGALLFTADERRAVRWRLFALVPFVVVALVCWARA